MKKTIYFIIQSIVNILLSIYCIIISNTMVKETVEELKQTYSSFPQELQNRMISIYEKAGVKITIFFAIIVIIINIFILIFAIKKTLLKQKGLIITFSILTFLFAENIFVQLFGIISFILILCSKRKCPEDFPNKEKKQMPKLSLKESNLKDIIYGILVLIVYFSKLVWYRFLPNNVTVELIVDILFDIIMVLLCIIVFYKELVDNFKILINNFKPYIKFIISRLGIAYLFLFIFSIISILLTRKATSVNQELLESEPFYYLIPMAVIYAPLVEEILFRGIFRRLIKNNALFILISGLVFGLLHTIGEASMVNIFVMAIPYVWLGCYLSYIYVKTNNIFSNIISHAIINSVAVVFMILI